MWKNYEAVSFHNSSRTLRTFAFFLWEWNLFSQYTYVYIIPSSRNLHLEDSTEFFQNSDLHTISHLYDTVCDFCCLFNCFLETKLGLQLAQSMTCAMDLLRETRFSSRLSTKGSCYIAYTYFESYLASVAWLLDFTVSTERNNNHRSKCTRQFMQNPRLTAKHDGSVGRHVCFTMACTRFSCRTSSQWKCNEV